MMPRNDTEEISPMEAEKKRMDISFRVSWSQAILFGCYEVTVSFVLVVISMLYYEKPAGPSLPALLSTSMPATLSSTLLATTVAPTTVTTMAETESTNSTSSPTTTSTTTTTTSTTTSTTTTTTIATTTTAPHTLCGSLFPTWQSAAWLVAFYSVVYLAILLANIHFIRQTKKKVHSKVSLFVILTHPAGRLLLGIIAFFITCAFAAPVDEEKGTLNQYINRISMHVTKTAMVVDAGFVIFFIVAIVKRESVAENSRESIWLLKSGDSSIRADRETDWLRLGTNVYATRQLIFIQVKFAVMVCFLSSHISVIILVLLVFFCHVFVFMVWARMVRKSRKAKAKYENHDYQDENDNTAPERPDSPSL